LNPLTLPTSIADALRHSHWRILVTGASGWLGQAALEMLSQTLGSGWDDRVLAFGSRERQWSLRDGTRVQQQPLASLSALPRQPSLLLHFAFLTREKTAQMPAQAYVDQNRALSRLAAEGGAAVGVERAFVTSSGAVHAALAAPDNHDPSLLYGRLKLEVEALFQRFAQSYIPSRAFIARLFNLSGPYINKLDSYALASFIQQARKGQINIRATHPVIRSYTSAANLLAVALGQLLAEQGATYLCVETAGEAETEMGELATAVRDGVAPNAVIQRTMLNASPVDRYVGDGTAYRQLLADYGIAEHSLHRQIVDTADYLAGLGA